MVAVVVVCLALPFVASVRQAVDLGWTPSNDDALITLRVYDVLDGEFPLVGQPSTADHYAGTDPPRHPGPIQFYLLAPALAVLGPDLGILVGTAAINLSAVLLAAWVVFRRAGPAVGLVGALLILGVLWAQGPAQLSDPVSSNMGGIPFLALALLAWAVVDGDVRLLPLCALAFAFVFQQHLAIVGMATAMALWAGVGLVVAIVAWALRRRAGRESESPWPWVALAAGTTLVAWLPVLVDQVAGSGNLSRMVRFAAASERETLGLASGVHQSLRALGVPPLLWRTDLTGHDMYEPLSTAAIVAALVVVGLLIAVVVSDRHERRGRSALAATALVIAVVGVVVGASIPESVEAGRLNFYRWMFVASAITWIAVIWWVIERVAPVVAERLSGPQRRTVATAATAVVLVTMVGSTYLAVVSSGPTYRRDELLFEAEEELRVSLLAAVDGHDRVLLVPRGLSSVMAVSPALAVDLVEAGHEVRVPADQEDGYGSHMLDDGEHDIVVEVLTGIDVLPEGPGRVVGSIALNEAILEANATVLADLRSGELVLADDAQAIMERIYGPDPGLAELYIAARADSTDRDLLDPDAARALLDGYLTSPVVDRSALQDLVDHPRRRSWGDDVIEVRVLEPADRREAAGGN